MHTFISYAGLTVLILFGVFLFFFGGYDDSPGAQGLGLILAAVGVFFTVKKVRSQKQ